MQYSKLSILKRNVANLPGWRTDKKLIIIESDDWGSIRMPSIETYDLLKSKGLDMDSCGAEMFNKYDALETAEDLEELYACLQLFKDNKGNNPVFTALACMANPDFERIESGNFRQYYYEPVFKTMQRLQNSEAAFKKWKEGISKRLFIPQFHGREHLNIAVWMKALQHGEEETLLAFKHQFWGYVNKHPYRVDYQAAFDVADPIEIELQAKVIEDGLKLFETLLGYKATYFVPPNGPFNNRLEAIAAKGGINYMYSDKIQKEAIGFGKRKKVFHYIGQKNKYGQTYISRNCFFEPSMEGRNWIENCLTDIEISFRWHKPAVICSHRVNYIGSLYKENRTKSLEKLSVLLTEILKKWPDAEFISSDKLGQLIDHG